MVYDPAEDSFLIQKEVKRLAKGRVLDMGTGSGILAETAANLNKVKSVLGVDIKKSSVEHCKENVKHRKVRWKVSDLFSGIPKTTKFDTIIFNPPYLPEQEGELWELKTEISGGKKGFEMIQRFFDHVNDYLQPNGIILLLFSTITGKMRVEDIIEQHMMEFEPLNKLNIMFEQLHVYKVMKGRFRKLLEKRGVRKIRPLARGHRGLVFTGMWRGKKISIKLQRQDIGAKGTVDNEVRQLKKLNRKGIGPKLRFSGKDYFAYDYIDGRFIRGYFDDPKTKKKDVLKVLRDVFEQMYTLDKMGLNKEEMHHPVKHIIVTRKGKPVLVDFERCKPKKKVHNVTQFVQFVISSRLIHLLEKHKIRIDMLEMLHRAQAYSKKKNRENFDRILELLK